MSVNLTQLGLAHYSGDPLTRDVDMVRFLVGDTKLDDPLRGDAEYSAALAISEQSARMSITLSRADLAVNGTTSAGATEINLDAAVLTGTLQAGMVFTIAGQSARYVVTSSVAASGNALSSVPFLPGLTAQATDNAAVTVKFANAYSAAAMICDSLAAEYAREHDIESSDGRRKSLSQKSSAFAARASALRSMSAAGRPGGAYFGRPVLRV